MLGDMGEPPLTKGIKKGREGGMVLLEEEGEIRRSQGAASKAEAGLKESPKGGLEKR